MHDVTADAFVDRWPDAARYRLRRAALDLHARAARGPLFYIAASIVFMLTIDSPGHLPPIAWLPALLYALLGVARFTNRVPADGADPAAYRRWRLRQWLSIDLGCLLWSGHLLVAGAIGPIYSLTVTVALLCTIAYGSAICHSFAMDRVPALIALICLSLPGTLAFGLIFANGIPIAIGIGVSGVYTAWMLDRSGRDYDAQIATEHALILAQAETERLVRTDSLTGLANRREYERRFTQAWHMAARGRGALALLVLDLDKFKTINDSYGHAAGDACLRHFAALLSQHFRRAGDLSARIGGEEFAIILPGVTAADAARLGEDFSAKLALSRCQYLEHSLQVTASIGAGAVDWDHDSDPGATFARIDQACYQAKKQGRSRLVAV